MIHGVQNYSKTEAKHAHIVTEAKVNHDTQFYRIKGRGGVPPGDKAFRPVKKFYELRNFTNTKRKNCPTCSFFNLINRQMCIKINRKVAFLSSTVGRKSHPPFHPAIFCRHSLKPLSPTFPKLMNWILLSPPPLSSEPDNPPKFGMCTNSPINQTIN